MDIYGTNREFGREHMLGKTTPCNFKQTNSYQISKTTQKNSPKFATFKHTPQEFFLYTTINKQREMQCPHKAFFLKIELFAVKKKEATPLHPI